MNLETEISPIDGLNKEQFEKIREQIIEYMKMYKSDGEAIGAYKTMKLFEPFYKAGERDNKNIESAIILLQEVKEGFLNPMAKIDKAISLLKL